MKEPGVIGLGEEHIEEKSSPEPEQQKREKLASIPKRLKHPYKFLALIGATSYLKQMDTFSDPEKLIDEAMVFCEKYKIALPDEIFRKNEPIVALRLVEPGPFSTQKPSALLMQLMSDPMVESFQMSFDGSQTIIKDDFELSVDRTTVNRITDQEARNHPDLATPGPRGILAYRELVLIIIDIIIRETKPLGWLAVKAFVKKHELNNKSH